MNKKLIKLTEGDLHRIIKESVNKVLTEMDWKTLMSASNVAKEKGKKWNDEYGENGRSKRFERAVREQFAKDKGYTFGGPSYWDKSEFEPNAEYNDYYIPANNEFEPHYGSLYTGDNVNGSFDNYDDYADEFSESDTHVRIPGRFMNNKTYDGLGDYATEYNPENPVHKKIYDDWQEIDDFNRGKYDYQKGKGWQKKQ